MSCAKQKVSISLDYYGFGEDGYIILGIMVIDEKGWDDTYYVSVDFDEWCQSKGISPELDFEEWCEEHREYSDISKSEVRELFNTVDIMRWYSLWEKYKYDFKEETLDVLVEQIIEEVAKNGITLKIEDVHKGIDYDKIKTSIKTDREGKLRR